MQRLHKGIEIIVSNPSSLNSGTAVVVPRYMPWIPRFFLRNELETYVLNILIIESDS